MKAKCPRGYSLKGNNCISSKKNSLLNPKDGVKKVLLWILIGMISFSAIIGASFLLFGSFNDTTLKILLTTLLISAGSLTALMSASGNRYLRIVGIFSSLIATGYWILVNWEVITLSNTTTPVLKFFVFLTSLAIVSGQIGLVYSLSKSKDKLVNSIFYLVTGMSIILLLMFNYFMLVEGNFSNTEVFWRIFGFVSILDVAGSISLPIIRRARS